MLVTILIVSFPVIKYYLPFFRRLNVTSAYEYLERRFNATTRLMASALFIIFMVARMALVLYLPSLALTAVRASTSTFALYSWRLSPLSTAPWVVSKPLFGAM